jgi:phosphomethylpyrimidine synthase
VVEATTLSVGSVPLYQAFIEAIRKYGEGVDMPEDDLFRVTEEQARKKIPSTRTSTISSRS